MVEFYPCSEKSPIVEIIDENYVVILHCGINIIYSISDDMFNATKLVKNISGTNFKKWKETKESVLFLNRFPHFIKIISPGGKNNRISGTYLHKSLLNVIVSWANPMLGYCLSNGITMEIMLDKSGYLYLVQPEKYIGTNIYKYGITWNTRQRFYSYGGDKCRVIHIEKVNDMFNAELSLHMRIDEEVDNGEIKILPQTREYIECNDFELLEYHYKEVCKYYKYDGENKDNQLSKAAELSNLFNENMLKED